MDLIPCVIVDSVNPGWRVTPFSFLLPVDHQSLDKTASHSGAKYPVPRCRDWCLATLGREARCRYPETAVLPPSRATSCRWGFADPQARKCRVEHRPHSARGCEAQDGYGGRNVREMRWLLTAVCLSQGDQIQTPCFTLSFGFFPRSKSQHHGTDQQFQFRADVHQTLLH